ncbi:ABC transporter substrate-binding protein [Desulfatitalea alkaliphila]|uniref:ABC transport system substrate-binding protein n=1 Tax=Desulfatitalea alkaliphila TaxID=2929485 RepID=A0AA41R5J1_9BACT|nr:ABC transporter substrate binding protein [Desulfatitalea alkaliphila]MCJ8502719.1 hypothetical protein [Desulfatitalea alkaliphila]
MNTKRIVLCLICLIVISLTAGQALAAAKVAVISGVSKASAPGIGYDLVYEGINKVFQSAGIVPDYHWVELDSLETPEAKTAAGAAALEKVRANNPDLIITLNDDCIRHIGLQVDDIPVVFAWVFGTPDTLGLPKANVTGVLRRSYAVDIWVMAKSLLNVETVALISKQSNSMAGVKRYLVAGADKLAEATGVRFMDMFLVDTFEEWSGVVNNFPADFIYLADTSRIAKGDKVFSRSEMTRWTVDNAKVPVIAASEGDVEAGALFSIVTSEVGIGENAAEVALKILDGTAPADIPYVSSARGKLVINAATAEKMGVTIPYDILSTAEAIYE